MTELTLSTSTDFTLTKLADVALITFTNAARTTVTATIDASQLRFSTTAFEYLVDVTGSGGANEVVIDVDTTALVYGLGFTFTSWSSVDRIRFLGDGQDNQIFSTAQDDFISGGAGNDIIVAWFSGRDEVLGGDGDDLLACSAGTVDGGLGTDRLDVIFQSATAVRLDIRDGGGGRNVGGLAISGIELVNAILGDLGDTVWGGALADTVVAALGDDQVTGLGGNDVLDGQEGNDTLLGGEGSDVLQGGAGNDVLTGGAGADYILGGAGADVLTGGAGVDRFVFRTEAESAPGAADTITDFRHLTDKIDLAWIEHLLDGSFRPIIYIGQAEFSPLGGPFGEARWYRDVAGTHVEVQPVATGPILHIDLTGQITLTREDFIL